jgi:hypothetical protein
MLYALRHCTQDFIIFKGLSPFDDGGELEVTEGHPEGSNIPFFPDAPQEFASGLDTELNKLTQQLQQQGQDHLQGKRQTTNKERKT